MDRGRFTVHRIRYTVDVGGMIEMARVIAVVNQKGGVGKTATVANVAWALAAMNTTCLAVDSDPQGSLTISLGFDPDPLGGHTLYEGMVLPPEHPQHRALGPLPVTLTGLTLVPANLDLAAAELDLNALRRALAPLQAAYTGF